MIRSFGKNLIGMAVITAAAAALGTGGVLAKSDDKTALVIPQLNASLSNGTFEMKDTQDLYELSGEIVSVDISHAMVVIKFPQDEEGNVYDKMNFYFKPHADMVKNGKPIGLKDLKEGDDVVVEYTTDANGVNGIESMVVE